MKPYHYYIARADRPPVTPLEFLARHIWVIIHAYKVRGSDSQVAAERLFNEIWGLVRTGSNVSPVVANGRAARSINSAMFDRYDLFTEYRTIQGCEAERQFLLGLPGIGPKTVQHLVRLLNPDRDPI